MVLPYTLGDYSEINLVIWHIVSVMYAELRGLTCDWTTLLPPSDLVNQYGKSSNVTPVTDHTMYGMVRCVTNNSSQVTNIIKPNIYD